jgi:hypothetical protein
MGGISPAERDEWSAAYRQLLTKATINFPGRRLVLKNPVNTARIRALLAVFPGAKFLHIYRNPYDVYRSTLHLHREVLKVTSLQRISEERIQEYVLDFYPRLMNAYWEQRDEVPAGDHAEVRFEDFVASPMTELERIYAELGLGPIEPARERFERILGKRQRFRPNKYAREPEHKELVDRHWGFAVERLGYAAESERETANA